MQGEARNWDLRKSRTAVGSGPGACETQSQHYDYAPSSRRDHDFPVIAVRTSSSQARSKPVMTPYILYITFPCALEEVPYHQHLQCCHAAHHSNLHKTEIEYPLFCASHCIEISVLSRSEIFLHPADCA